MIQNSEQEIPSLCLEVQDDLSAIFDGEVQVLEKAVIETHLNRCSKCTQYQSELQSLDDQLRSQLSPTCDADQLWARILDSIEADKADELDQTTGKVKSVNTYSKGFKKLTGVALAASIMIGVLVSGLLFESSNDDALPLIAETVRDFETFQIRGELLDVDNSKMSSVVQWMSAKVDFDLPDAAINPPSGFTVQGGRLCSLLNRRSAFFYYEKDSDMLSLYVMKADGLAIPHEGEFKTSTTQAGLTTVSWAQDDLAYVIVSELSAEEVVKFASRS